MVIPKKGFSQNQLVREAVIFIASFLIVAGALTIILSPIEPFLQKAEAGQSQSILHAVGVNTNPAENPIQFWMNGKHIEISPLCSGLLEMILLASAIIVTPTASIRKKTIGIITGVFILYTFNLVRIVVTLLQLEHASFSFAEITHDILFRVILIIGFALLYSAWLNSKTIRSYLHANNWY